MVENATYPFSPGFDIELVQSLAEALPSHSWEYGTAIEALLELFNPELSVFGYAPFPVPTKNSDDVQALVYARSKIVLGTGANALSDGAGAVGDPASLGVSAVLLGKTNATLADAATRQVQYVVNQAPRWVNGAISHRADVAELWADFMYMAPPFMAYYAVDTNNATMLQDAINQGRWYRDVLQRRSSSSSATTTSACGSPSPTPTISPFNGKLWEHIIGPQSQDVGIWSTGNAWASAGMTRVFATVKKVPAQSQLDLDSQRLFGANWRQSALDDLATWILEILDGAMATSPDAGLLRNYMDNLDTTSHGYGEISGSTMIASVAYRMATLYPSRFGSKYVQWADSIRAVIGDGNHISSNGAVHPAVNPLNWSDTTPFLTGSPEGNNFVVLLYTAWRDCVNAGICRR
ncbi:hypothetical protein BDN72DRAFT_779178 [Pluteus cervinus]|uniref:Uncharacterized protein n=1 Tax=Pluteus cervinus TaxID=181527 RepID=A0ACD3A5B5_9AGAR|nr:hypothetical protein BDN72DRAFT_779178 [Pluteus cervinus]